MPNEPVVRIRFPTPEDESRCRRALESAGLTPESSLTWLVVRDADPDEVNRVLVAAGALGRVVVRESIGKLIGWIIDRQGALDGRARNVKSLVERTFSDGGLATRWAPRSDDELLASARALHARLMAEGAPFLSWGEFLALFARPRAGVTA